MAIKEGTGEFPCPFKETHDCKTTFTNESGAIRHAVEKHGYADPYVPKKIAKKGQGKTPCPCADTMGCTEKFSGRSNACRHAKKKHNWSNPNPMATTGKRPLEGDKGESALKSVKGEQRVYKRRPAKCRLGKELNIPCTFSEGGNCSRMFSSESSMLQHARRNHNYRAPAEGTVPCILAKEKGCTAMFKTQNIALMHARKQHGFKSKLQEGLDERKVFPCPLAKRFKCESMFIERKAANQHIFNIHQVQFGEYHCPEVGCNDTLFELEKCEDHLKEVHGLSEDVLKNRLEEMAVTSPSAHLEPKDFRFQCATRSMTGCLKVFQTPWGMEDHVKENHPEEFNPDVGVELIPWYEVEHAPKMRLRDGGEVPARKDLPQPKRQDGLWLCQCQDQDCTYTAKEEGRLWKHYLSVHMDVMWLCRHSEALGCNATFDLELSALRHSADHFCRWKCQFPNCTANAQDWKMTANQIISHKMMHRQYNHLDDVEWNPERVCPSAYDIPKTANDPYLQLAQVKRDPNVDQDQARDEDEEDTIIDRDDPMPDDEQFIDDDDIAEVIEGMSALVPGRRPIDYSELSSDRRSDSQQSSLKSRALRMLGLRCIGPSPVYQMMVSEFCPGNTIFTEENLVFFERGAKRKLVLSRRCRNCISRADFRRMSKGSSLEKAEGQVFCRIENCDEPIWGSTALCRVHVLEWTPSTEVLGPELIETLQDQFWRASRNQWQPKETSILGNEVLATMKSGILKKSGMPLIVCIDLEAHIRTKRIFQIGICDTSGKKLLDCHTILDDNEKKRTAEQPGTKEARMQEVFELQARSRPSADGSLTVHQVAARLKELFPRPQEVVFISWATWEFDLGHLRGWIEAAGYSGVLPGDDRCYLILNDYWANFAKFLGTSICNDGPFPLRLPVLFPIIMGQRHSLVGKNHHALVDAKQLAHLVTRFVDLCQGTPQTRPLRQSRLSFQNEKPESSE